MSTLLGGMMIVLVAQVLYAIAGWIVLWRMNSHQRRIEALESELKQFRGVAKLQDIPKEQRNDIQRVA